MSNNTLAKNLHQCFPLIKPLKHQLTNSSPNKNINRHRHDNHYHHQKPINTTYTKSYSSVFENSSCLLLTTSPTSTTSPSVSDIVSDIELTDTADPDTPDLTAAYASRRFFISSPGQSNSIVDSLSTTTTISSSEDETKPPPVVVDGVAVETYSPNPYLDFRRSMEEMVVAREVARGDLTQFWHYLQELLLNYLLLNPKNTHKYIVKAFGDMIINHLSPNNSINVTVDLVHNSINNSNSTSSSSSPFSSYCSKTNCIIEESN